MARYNGKKALYEVIKKTNINTPYSSKKDDLSTDDAQLTEKNKPKATVLADWPNKPKVLRFIAGRMELSLAYPAAVAVVLCVVLLMLLLFRLGQNTAFNSTDNPIVAQDIEIIPPTAKPVGAKPAVAKAKSAAPAKNKGDHRIILTQYHRTRDLEPVRKHFAAFGIATVIERRGSRYYLLTGDRVENPNKQGTDGYLLKKKIKEVGAKYKAQQGYESFAPNLFRDAYGEKIK